MSWNPRIALRAMALFCGCAVAASGASAGASYRAPAQAPAVTAHVGSLTVVDAFLPEPPSPAVAAIYLTVKNSGSRSDALIGVTSGGPESSMLMTENPNGPWASCGNSASRPTEKRL